MSYEDDTDYDVYLLFSLAEGVVSGMGAAELDYTDPACVRQYMASND